MPTRTASSTVTFTRPFRLTGVGEMLPAGTYTVETEEELIDGVSFPAYRRTATLLRIPPGPAGSATMVASIDPRELRAALEADAEPTSVARTGAASPDRRHG
ncbi:MAG TPA: hypothetical protein VEB20_22985 [Azospirillaceae bacterium]|nr:hypothetical protein [Azospirillaceae bacterium]